MQKNFDLQGHRGCRGLMPENTIPSFIKAIDIGVSTLEMDAVITKDLQVIMSHEPFFNHEITTKANGELVPEATEKSMNIFEMTYAETTAFDVGMKSHPRFPEQQKKAVHKPLLQDVIDSVIQYCKKNETPVPFFNIETKSHVETDNIFHPAPAQFVELIMQVVKAKKMEEKTILQSFDFRTLQYLHEHYPLIKTAALIEDYDTIPFSQQLKKLGFIPSIYSPAWELVTPLLVKQCKDMGIKLIPWTINDASEMKRFKLLGVDGLITDYPNRYVN
ncbi:MAG: glycerophosphodiester phosphodiesterase family protein [Bacteroidota bacterium]